MTSHQLFLEVVFVFVGKSRPIYNLEGSLFKWANESRPLVDNSGSPTKLVHPYNNVWGRLLEKSLHANV